MIDTRELSPSVPNWPAKPDVSAPQLDAVGGSNDPFTVTDVAPPPAGLGAALIEKYIGRAMLRSTAEPVEGGWFAELTVVPNVWGDGDTAASALIDLEAVLRHWIELKLRDRDGDIPIIDGINLNVL